SLSGPISPALPIASKLPDLSPTIWQMIGTPACRARAQLSAFGAAFSSRVSNWSVDEKYCDLIRRRSLGYWLPGPNPGEYVYTARRPDSFRPAMQASLCAGVCDTCDVSTVVVTPAFSWLSEATSSEM